MEQLMTAEEVSAIIAKTEGALAQDRFLGRGIPFIKMGKTVRYKPSDVEAYIEASRRTQTGQVA